MPSGSINVATIERLIKESRPEAQVWMHNKSHALALQTSPSEN